MVYAVIGIALIAILLLILLLRAGGRNHTAAFDQYDITFHSQRLNAENIARHMKNIAGQHQTRNNGRCSSQLFRYSRKSWRNLARFNKTIRMVPDKLISLVPASQWLIDNYYVINREIKVVKHNFSPRFYQKMPCLQNESMQGYLRIYAISREMLKTTDLHVGEDNLADLINAYQEVKPLTIGELWAFPNILKVSLIESIHKIAGNIVESIQIKEHADALMNDVLQRTWSQPDEILQRLEARFDKKELMNSRVVTHILFRLKEVDMEESVLEQWLQVQTGKSEYSLSDVIRQETQHQSLLQVKISAAVTSLIEVAAIDWERLFTEVSVVERILAGDSSGIYPRMSFPTRDEYHHEVERMSRHMGISEVEVAQKAMELSDRSYQAGARDVTTHVGYYLMGKGKLLLAENVSFTPIGAGRLYRWIRYNVGKLYFAGLFVLSLLLVVTAVGYTLQQRPAIGIGTLVGSAIIFTIISVTIATEVMNYIFTKNVRIYRLPSMDFDKGIPVQYSTMVVMPVITASAQQLHKYLERLETYYLGNRHDHLYFGVLGDYTDAEQQKLPGDEEITRYAVSRVCELNKKYGKDGVGPFFYFHRHRKWNENERCWMGWERKRGKLEEFNSLLRGDKNTSYHVTEGNSEVLEKIKYVLTIDADTELTRNSAARLIGIMAHPLNKPVLNEAGNCVVEGYTLLQPRIGIRMESAMTSSFSRIFSGQSGVNPYIHAISDVYQDTFGEGIFTGKGIYDVDIFHKVMEGTIPENTVLSHDLLEGSYVRCGLVTDIELMDGCPSTVASFFKREHRWIRGDWQLLGWLGRRGPINGLSRWKILDNMRRSLVPVCQLVFIFLASTVLHWEWIWWAAVVLFSMLFSLAVNVINTLAMRARRAGSGIFASDLMHSMSVTLSQALLLFILIPYRAYISLDAILRTLYRLFVSHKKLLEWQTAESAENSVGNTLAYYVRKMWIEPAAGAVLAVTAHGSRWWGASLVAGVLWFFGPWISYRISMPYREHSKKTLDSNEIREVRKIARKTWRYFEELFAESDHWLTPDNYQVSPGNVLARRASPTNIGLQLLATVSARDLGYISLGEMMQRLDKIFETIQHMEKWHGHLYNWYDTRTLEILPPRYISTVDSGNFIGYLLVLKHALKDMDHNKPVRLIDFYGMEDTAAVAEMKETLAVPASIEEFRILLEGVVARRGAEDDKEREGEDRELLLRHCTGLLEDIENLELSGDLAQLPSLKEIADSGNKYALELYQRMEALLEQIEQLVDTTDFRPLYENRRNLFRVGCNVSTNTPDHSCYDLLASEARLASFIAISKGEIPLKHWFKLGRPLALIRQVPTLISWSGTMFEYLLPNQVMRILPGTLLQRTCRTVVERQIEYGKNKKVPWGISESGYYHFDQQLNYQYRAFGVPGLGFRSDLRKSLVIAPYASLMAISIAPREVYENMRVLQDLGAEGKYGFYEALDYLSPTVTDIRSFKLVKSFMIHHQGMALLAIDNFINDNIHSRRFHQDPLVKSTEVVLEERQPFGIVIESDTRELSPRTTENQPVRAHEPRVVRSTKLKYPVAHVLSNNHYTVMLTSNGSSSSTWNDIAINRWRPVLTKENYGTFFYIRDTVSKKCWSSTYYPTATEPQYYMAVFSNDKAEFRRRDGSIETRTEVAVSPQDNVEVRKITLTNRGAQNVKLEVTSYFEPVIDTYEADLAHPAFSKLFIATEFVADKNILLATRRSRTEHQSKYFVMHTVSVQGKMLGNVEYETNRSIFIGRGNTLKNPKALRTELPLTKTAGYVLDPIMSLQVNVSIPAGKSTVITYITGIADSRDAAIEMGARYQNVHAWEDTFKLAQFDSEVEMQYLGLNYQQANSIQELVGSIYYPTRLLRGPVDIIEKNRLGQPSLWKFGISGDQPIMLLRVRDSSEVAAVKDVILAYEYMRRNGIRLDFVILIEETEGYLQPIHQQIMDIISNRKIYYPNAKTPGVFVLKAGEMTREEIGLLMTVSRVVLTEKNRILSRRLKKRLLEEIAEVFPTYPILQKREYKDIPLADEDLKYANGIGGFTQDGKEYVVNLKDTQNTPLPWVNIISNEIFGFQVSATGTGYTWSQNSRENKVTVWSNDPVVDPPSEVVYIKDEITGEFFTPTASPIREREPYRARHGIGYTVFEHNSHEIKQKMTVFTGERDAVKIYSLSLENASGMKRDLSLYFFVEWVMGVTRDVTAPYIVTDIARDGNMLTVRNPYNVEFKDRIAFISASEKLLSYSGDKMEFIGRTGSYAAPTGLLAQQLSNRVGAALDPCGAIQVGVELEPGETRQVVFILGEAENMDAALLLAQTYRRVPVSSVVYRHTTAMWKQLVEQIQVKTPDEGMNILLNGWLLYQVLSCRVRSRSAFYQSGGAFGFRDQLQDVMALLHAAPHIARAQILRSCSRQFIEGDVQHWWHHDSGKGVRTRISDDLLFLPYVTAAYIQATGDAGILEEEVSFIEDAPLEPHEMERFTIPRVSGQKASVYEHCLRAIHKGHNLGERGLILMGAGDWNDGMNRVGWNGKGESVWLSWFTYRVLLDFREICLLKNHTEKAAELEQQASQLIENIEKHCWDGDWYLRAFFDNGQPLGSRQNDECRIDAISQTWSVISGGADPRRAAKALESLRKYLVKEEEQILLLLTPAFDKTVHDPGYIKGYLPGIRENGGQYTHAAVWNVIAFAKWGDGDAAYDMYRMLLPTSHSHTYAEAMKYKQEPYVMSADIYSCYPHVGRGGWSWYTGSAGWMYQAGIYWMLGIQKLDDRLVIEPNIPSFWEGYSFTYKHGNTVYEVNVTNPNRLKSGVTVCTLVETGEVLRHIPLLEDGGVHHVNAVIQPRDTVLP